MNFFNGYLKQKVDVGIMVKIIIIVFSLGVAYTTLRITTTGIKDDIKILKPMINIHETKLAVIESKLDDIKTGIDEIKYSLRRNR